VRHAAAAAAAVAIVAGFGRSAAAPSPDPGERAFEKCYACHSVDPAETGLPGPNLAGIIARRAGTASGFEYSAAMQAAGARGLVWDRATLDRFLVDPAAVVPGTAMAPPDLDSEQERRSVVEYLAKRR